jgi:hypothetical protein
MDLIFKFKNKFCFSFDNPKNLRVFAIIIIFWKWSVHSIESFFGCQTGLTQSLYLFCPSCMACSIYRAWYSSSMQLFNEIVLATKDSVCELVLIWVNVSLSECLPDCSTSSIWNTFWTVTTSFQNWLCTYVEETILEANFAPSELWIWYLNVVFLCVLEPCSNKK